MASWDDDGYYDISFAIGRSRRYHAKMWAYYRKWHHGVLASMAITGTSAFVSTFAIYPIIPKVLTALVAIASTLDLVFDFSRRADQHQSLCRRFTELAAEIEDLPATEENLRRVKSKRLRIDADEPTPRRIIDLWARNEELRARGVSHEEFVPLSRPQVWLGYLCDFGVMGAEDWYAKRAVERAAEAKQKADLPNDRRAEPVSVAPV